MGVTSDAPRRLIHYTPLRYPGGKGKLASFVKNLITANDLLDGHYVEPFAGGAGIALELLFHEYASHIHINDVSRPVFSFWKSVLEHSDGLLKLVRDTPLTVGAWDKQKKILANPSLHDDLSLGFATFFLNRTNRSGILNGGIIGGRDQTGPWKIDARYNSKELAFRIESIAKLRNRISLTGKDAVEFLRIKTATLPTNTLFYLDPPYYVKGKDLYYDYYQHKDHVKIAESVFKLIKKQRWIVSYDNVVQIRELYRGRPQVTYELGYSARDTRSGSEVMVFSQGLTVPPATAAMKFLRRRFCHTA